jgi:CheY-like chemotaxis protein
MSKRILVVEDQEDLRAILRDFLSAYGYTVIEAVNGAESVAKAASERPDIVLMDSSSPCSMATTRRGRSRRCPVSPRSRYCGQFLRHEGGRREGKSRRV